MYCKNCGKEVLDTDKYCSNCGNIIDIKQYNNQKIKSSINNNPEIYSSQVVFDDLPMNWWKFWQYVRFPLGIFLTVCNIISYLPELEVNMITIFALLTDISILALMITTYYHFLNQSKIGYKFLNAWLIIELACNALNVTTTSIMDYSTVTLMDFAVIFIYVAIFWGLTWTLPNYIYFKKRKHCFNDGIEISEKETIEYKKQDEELTRIIERL